MPFAVHLVRGATFRRSHAAQRRGRRDRWSHRVSLRRFEVADGVVKVAIEGPARDDGRGHFHLASTVSLVLQVKLARLEVPPILGVPVLFTQT